MDSNPPIPGGWKYISPQSLVTPAMTDWAVAILDDPTAYPMFWVGTQYFDGYKWVLARVEHHSNAERGVSLFMPTSGWTNTTVQSIPATCSACGNALLLANLYVDDGCPCNSPRGVNFQPQPCKTCDVPDCVKPGHRLSAIFGDFVRCGLPKD